MSLGSWPPSRTSRATSYRRNDLRASASALDRAGALVAAGFSRADPAGRAGRNLDQLGRLTRRPGGAQGLGKRPDRLCSGDAVPTIDDEERDAAGTVRAGLRLVGPDRAREGLRFE